MNFFNRGLIKPKVLGFTFLAGIILPVLVGCPDSGSGPDVYVAGGEYNDSHRDSVSGLRIGIAKVWKNGAATNLSDGTYDAYAYSVYVSGRDVYVAGFEDNAKGIGVAKVWKNGAPTNLSDGTHDAVAHSVYVSGRDVYAAGTEDNDVIDDAGYHLKVAKVWRIDAAATHTTNLSDGTGFAYAFSVYVSGRDVYVAGYESNDRVVAKVWKNGAPTNLSDGTYRAEAHSVYVSGRDVYVAGFENNAKGIGIAKVWKNGVPTNLSGDIGFADAYSVYVSGRDVYVAGFENKANGNSVIKLWKNGAATPDLADVTGFARAYSVYVSGRDVYVAGSESNDSGYYVAKVWKNGAPTDLSADLGHVTAESVFVK